MPDDNNKSTTTDNTFSKKIGKANYNVQVFFSKTSKESFNDKLRRLIKNDIANEAKQA
ncbi:MAG: transposon-encoded TnpW family protein [Defluviitaleaceae bacterium]|nr:transposon-encoded TnpW family protein [Defluviitaleaceae bacterium]